MTTLSRTIKALGVAGLAALALLAAAPADAHGGRWRGGVHIGIGVPYWGWGGYWGPSWYYAPPPVVYAPAPVYAPRPYAPPVYVERDDDRDDAPRAEPQAPVWWYWCPGAKGYHPYVKDCPGGWQRVPPQPVPQ